MPHPVNEQSGTIATPHNAATRAGERAFERGGTAIDAALAAAAVLSVVYPHNVSIGGDLFAVVRDPQGTVRCINASGPAAVAADAEALRHDHGDELPYRGIDTVTVPGALRGWEALHRLGAKRPWFEIFDDAVAAAEGAPVARSLADAFVTEREAIGFDRGFRAVFAPEGRFPTAGEVLAQPALRRTLEILRRDGADALYEGALTGDFLAGLATLGAAVTAPDLLLYRPETVEPLSTGFGPWTVHTSPPNSQGFALLRVLEQLDALEVSDPLGAGLGTLMTLFHRANLLRDEHLGDPRSGTLTLDELLTADAFNTASPVGAGFERPRGDTVGIAAADSSGWSVSLIQSVYHAFGSGVLEPSTGILLHNRGTSFSLRPGSPNLLAPGRRPLHTLMPVIVTEEGRLRAVSATMGGQGQPQIHAQVLLRVAAGASAAQAVAAPRAIVGPQQDGDGSTTVYLEDDLTPEARASVARTTLDPRPVPQLSELVGHANLVLVAADGSFDSGSDPRADGSASTTLIGGAAPL
jgi:gamma-glutamyltranspeptidase